LETFLDANIGSIEDWVDMGGHLFLNAAPNEGDGMSFGFGGVSLVYADFCSTADAVDLGHPIFAGPFTPVGTTWTGTSFGHATISGGGTTLIDDNADGGVVLSELSWGAGTVLFGGMTTTNFHSPAPEAGNLRRNILSYLSCGAVDVCAPVTGLMASGATLSWDDAGATKYRYAVSDLDATPIQKGQTFGLSVTLSSLIPGSTYTARVARDCYPDGWSTVEILEFTVPLRQGDFNTAIKVYPNPSNGQFRVQLNGYNGSNLNIQIMNMVGQVVYNNMINVLDDVTAEEIDLGNVPAGTYMVRITDGEQVTQQTIVIE
jgi:hypothetical protein